MIAITFTPASGAAYVLADGTATAVSRDLRTSLSRSVQVSQGLRWSTVKVLPRYNQQISVSFMVQRLHASEDDASEYILTHKLAGSGIPSGVGELSFSVTGGGTYSGKLENAVVQQCDSNQRGATSFSTFVFIGTDIVDI